jgi:hypothetical protein
LEEINVQMHRIVILGYRVPGSFDGDSMEKESVVHYKRLVLEITKDLHANIKSRAAVRNITMRKWVMMAIVEQIKRETAVY